MVEPPRLSQWQTVSTRDSKSIPIRKNLSSRSECLLSGTTRAYGSEKRVGCRLEAHAVLLGVDGGLALVPLEVYVPVLNHIDIIHTRYTSVRPYSPGAGRAGDRAANERARLDPADREHLLGYFCFHERGLIEEPKSYSDAWEREGTTASSERPDLIESISPRRPQP